MSEENRILNNNNNNNNNNNVTTTPPGFSTSNASISDEKRGRGRPRGSGRLQLLASLGGVAAETAGGIFIPHVIIVNPGEDIVSVISSFARKGPRAVCVISATGVVSSAILRQSSSGGLLRYEGCFEILTLSGSFTFSETSSTRRKTGLLNVTLAQPDGRVFGGYAAGSLIASGPIQLILASFKQNMSKEIKLRQPVDSSTCGAFEDSETERFPTQIDVITDGGDQENCTTPKSAVSEPRNGEARKGIAQNHHTEATPRDRSEENVSKSPKHNSDHTLSPALK